MKTILYFFSLGSMLIFLTFSCTEGNDSSDGYGDTPTIETARDILVNGQAFNIKSQEPIDSLIVQGPVGPPYISFEQGIFIFAFPDSLDRKGTLSAQGYDPLRLGFGEVDSLIKLNVFLEETGPTGIGPDSIRGTTRRLISNTDTLTTPVRGIMVVETTNEDTVYSKGDGTFAMEISTDQPNMAFFFRTGLGSPIGTINIRMLSAIKDSARMDVVMSNNVIGIEIDTATIVN